MLQNKHIRIIFRRLNQTIQNPNNSMYLAGGFALAFSDFTEGIRVCLIRLIQ
jgi:hypothetical protein